DGRLDTGAIGYVTMHELAAPAATGGAFPCLGRSALSCIDIDVRDHDLGPFLNEPSCGGGADPATATGDEGDLSLQSRHRFFSYPWLRPREACHPRRALAKIATRRARTRQDAPKNQNEPGRPRKG